MFNRTKLFSLLVKSEMPGFTNLFLPTSYPITSKFRNTIKDVKKVLSKRINQINLNKI